MQGPRGRQAELVWSLCYLALLLHLEQLERERRRAALLRRLAFWRPRAAIAYVQDAGTSWATATTAAPSFASNATVGNLIVAVCGISSTAQYASAMSGVCPTSGTGAWLHVADAKDSTGGKCISIWAGICNSAATTVTVTLSASCNGGVTIIEFSGATMQLDGAVCSGSSSSAAPTMPVYQPLSANSLIISAFTCASNPTITAPGGTFTALTKQVSGTAESEQCAYAIQTTATAVTPAWSLGTANVSQMLDIGFQATGTTSTPYIRQWRGSGGTGTPTTVQPLTPLTTSTLLCIGTVGGTTTTTITITDGTNTYVNDGSKANGTGQLVQITRVASPAASSVTPSAAGNGTVSSMSLVVMEWVSLTASPLDVVGAGTTGASTAPSDGGVTTVNANDILISACWAVAGNITAMSAGYGSSSVRNQQNSTICGAYNIKSATGTYTNTYTVATSASWSGIVISYKYTAAITDYAHPAHRRPLVAPQVRRLVHEPRIRHMILFDRSIQFERPRRKIYVPPRFVRHEYRVRFITVPWVNTYRLPARRLPRRWPLIGPIIQWRKLTHYRRLITPAMIASFLTRRIRYARRWPTLAVSRARRGRVARHAMMLVTRLTRGPHVMRRAPWVARAQRRAVRRIGVVFAAPILAFTRGRVMRRAMALRAQRRTRASRHALATAPVINTRSARGSRGSVMRRSSPVPAIAGTMARRRQRGSRRIGTILAAPVLIAARRGQRYGGRRQVFARAVARRTIRAARVINFVAGPGVIDAIVIWRNRGGY